MNMLFTSSIKVSAPSSSPFNGNYLPTMHPKELVGDMSIALLMATFPYTPSFSYLGHPHVPADEMLHLPVALSPKELVGDMSIAVLMANFPHTPSLSY